MLVIGLGFASYGWAIFDSLRKHERARAALWLASGLLLGAFAALAHLGAARWLLAIALLASMTFGLTAVWRSEVRRWRGQRP